MTIILDGSGLTIEKMVRIARYGEPVELAADALERIKVCRAMLERFDRSNLIMVYLLGVAFVASPRHADGLVLTKGQDRCLVVWPRSEFDAYAARTPRFVPALSGRASAA